MKKEKNYLIEFWRVMFCITVLGVHFGTATNRDWFHSAYMGVEYFFLVSGYFTGAYYMKHMNGKPFSERMKSLWDYFYSRVKRLFPMYWVGMAFMVIVRLFLKQYTLSMLPGLLKRSFLELFMLQWIPVGDLFGYETEIIVSTNWFMPAIFFGSLIVVFLLALFGKWQGLLIGPIITFSVYGYFMAKINKFDIIISYYSIIRGVAAVSIGVFVYFLVQTISFEKNREKQWFMNLCTILSTVLFTVVFVYTIVGHHGKGDFLMSAVLALGLFILNSSKPVAMPKWFGKVFGFIGGQTFTIYQLHFPIIQVLVAIFYH